MEKALVNFLTKPVTLVVTLALSIVAAGGSYYMYQNSQQELAKVKSDPRSMVQEESKALIAKVGALVVLPDGEEPTIATITDIEKLKEQPFFAKAQNGDKVLIYTQTKKAYLYSASMNKVLEIAPVNIGNQQSEVAGASTEEKKPTPTRAPRKAE